MPTVEATEGATFTKHAGAEPIPGYRLLEPLGRGGFGEVWKCSAPGDLHKAIKFVTGRPGGDGTRLSREYEAFQQVKTIRHPYMLGLERVERLGDELVMVMPLADQNLGDRFDECVRAGLPGIPHAELLGYLREAAEALDVIGTRHGLQHLDVKPANLFLTAGHVQVGDYGLVSKLARGTEDGAGSGYTPRYVPPEVLGGSVHTRSDQYSLALVYQELLTGSFPFNGLSTYQLIFQHASVAPDLSTLPASDQGAVGRALAKRPDDRFGSCREFIDALAAARGGPPTPALIPVSSGSVPDGNGSTPVHGQPNSPTVSSGTRLPRLVGIKRAAPREPEQTPPPPTPARAAHGPDEIRLPLFLSVLPVAWLLGQGAADPQLSPADLVRAVLGAAGTVSPAPPDTGAVAQQADGSWACRFLTTIDPRIARVKLDVLWEQTGAEVGGDGNRVVGRFSSVPAGPPPGGRLGGSAKKTPPASEYGLEVEVRFPDPDGAVARVVAVGRVFGAPPPAFAQTVPELIVSLLDEVCRILNNVPERRTHTRLPAAFPVTLFPVTPDGRVGRPLSGRCLDVSAGGVAVRVATSLPTEHGYLAFDDVPGTTGLSILIQVVRTQRRDAGTVLAGRYRMDMLPDPAA